MEIIRRHDEFTDEEIEEFQDEIDLFYEHWINMFGMFGQEGITNYIHMMGAGHFAYFLHRYRNLYRFCQQGWEAINFKIKSIFMHNTQHGGHGAVKRSMLLQIIWFLQHDMMWRSGYGDQFFQT